MNPKMTKVLVGYLFQQNKLNLRMLKQQLQQGASEDQVLCKPAKKQDRFLYFFFDVYLHSEFIPLIVIPLLVFVVFTLVFNKALL